MTDTKWTPGPWSVPHIAETDARCNCRYVLAEYGGMGSIAEVSVCEAEEYPWGDDCGPNLFQAQANARLIAAAPELYEALELAATKICEAGGHLPSAVTHALAKARGDA